MISLCMNLYALYINTKVGFWCLEKEQFSYSLLNLLAGLVNVICVGNKLNSLLGI